jgi:hypothetical protein
MYRLFCVALLAILISSTALLHAQQKPDPSLSAEAVVALQLDGLKRNDAEGMQLVWEFAHPDNKRFTGPIDRFALMLTQPDYKILLGHKDAEIRLVLEEANVAIFEVSVTGAEGGAVIYRWGLRKVDEGEQKGSWMTVTVSPPLGTGNEI